jgi:hypothetical protein
MITITINKYNLSSFWYLEAINAWIDFDEGMRSLIETYDYLDYLFYMETKY